ncbi:MAG TPA: PQQ-dependent sugar dehydrogenase [bacterium]|nr:PQQ-dependent sugar dehydrogenase [bacterium]
MNPRRISLAAVLSLPVALSFAVVPPQAQSAPNAPVQLERVATGLTAPVYVTSAGGRADRLFIVEQGGRIRILRGGRLLSQPFLDISAKVVAGGELGLLSVAFHPRFNANGRFFVNYTTDQGGRLRTVIAEYRVSSAGRDVAEPGERVLLEIDQPFRNHNGGLNLFGPDGMLYIGMGDGGSGGDPQNNGQRMDTLLGKLLRIDVNGEQPYAVPPDNPFVNRPGVRPEIWAIGLRNPWRFSFDRESGRLFLADVGQNQWEEINIVEPGGNYGWRIMEAAHCFNPASGCDRSGLVLPIAEYDHSQGGCSVTGGYVYRGNRVRALAGRYLFADYCSGRVWTLAEGGGRWSMAVLLNTDLRITSFGEDASGELYVVDHGGAVYRLTARP